MTKNFNLPDVTVGDYQPYNFTFTDDEGNPFDITGWTLYFTLKRSAQDSDDDALITKDITTHEAPLDGNTSFDLSSTETDVPPGIYVYDFQIKDADGEVRTLTIGTVEFTRDVTQRT